MLNEPPSGDRRPHPLERQPAPPPPPDRDPETGQPRQRAILHIPTVKPTVTYALIAINILIFVVRALSPSLNLQFFEWGASNPVLVLQNGEYYRLFSAMFLHASIYTFNGQFALQNSMHLIFNMYALYVIGTSLEGLFGHRRFALIYLLGGLGGSVLSAVLSPPQVFSVGASGAVFAIFGAEFIYLYRHRRLLGQAGRNQMRALIWLAVINFGFGILSTTSSAGPNIDNWAHLGGMLGGLALTWFIGPIYITRTHPDLPRVSDGSRPVELLAVDVNPLAKRYWMLSAYASVLLVVLIVASWLVRG